VIFRDISARKALEQQRADFIALFAQVDCAALLEQTASGNRSASIAERQDRQNGGEARNLVALGSGPHTRTMTEPMTGFPA
jgi:hypothetical protein